MSWSIRDDEFRSVMALLGPTRYEYFVKRVADHQEVWSLKSTDGWVMASDSASQDIFPIWPHARFAEACATGSWHDCKAQSIPLKDWLDRWMPGLIRDQRHLAVFPTLMDKGVLVSPERLQADVLAECENYEDD